MHMARELGSTDVTAGAPQQLPQHRVVHAARRRDAECLEQELAEHLEHHLRARKNRAW